MAQGSGSSVGRFTLLEHVTPFLNISNQALEKFSQRLGDGEALTINMAVELDISVPQILKAVVTSVVGQEGELFQFPPI